MDSQASVFNHRQSEAKQVRMQTRSENKPELPRNEPVWKAVWGLPDEGTVAFLGSGGTGHPSPQLPHLPWPPMWCPVSSTWVEHQARCSVRWAWSQVHSWCSAPLNVKGKMQGSPGDAPPTVTQIFSVSGTQRKWTWSTVGTKMRSSISCYRTILILRSCFIEAHLRFRIFCLHTLKS